jgi:hypothetical protein
MFAHGIILLLAWRIDIVSSITDDCNKLIDLTLRPVLLSSTQKDQLSGRGKLDHLEELFQPIIVDITIDLDLVESDFVEIFRRSIIERPNELELCHSMDNRSVHCDPIIGAQLPRIEGEVAGLHFLATWVQDQNKSEMICFSNASFFVAPFRNDFTGAFRLHEVAEVSFDDIIGLNIGGDYGISKSH